MTELAEPVALGARQDGLLARLVSVRVQVSRELAAYAALMLVAAGMRFWDLGARALHHDESLHSWTAWKIFEGQGYHHEPWMHGPFQFFSTAFGFFMFGDSGYTARLVPVIFGSALVALPYFLRHRLGTLGAFLAAAGIALSPTLLYFSRFPHNEIYIAFFTLGLITCLWRYVDDQKPLYLYAAALLLGLSFATKVSTFINAAVLIAFLDAWMAVHFWRQLRERNRLEAAGSIAVLALILPFAWALVALWPFVSRWRQRVGLTDWHPGADFLLLLGTLTAPQFAAAIQVPLEALFGIDDADLARPTGDFTRENVLGFFTILTLVAAAAVVGLRWNVAVWPLAAAAFYVPYALLYTSFFTDLDGFYSGHWNALDYWLGQQNEARGEQPWFYYLMLLPAYEFLPLVFAAPALFYYAIKGDVFRRFLVFWFFAVVFGYSWAGEKMPWLSVNTALPVVIIGALFLADIVASGAPMRAVRGAGPYVAPLAAAGLGVLLAVGILGPTGGAWPALRVLIALAAALCVAALVLQLSRREPEPPQPARRRRQPLPQQPGAFPTRQAGIIGASALAGALLAATLFVGVRLTYQLGDVPRELLVFTQTSPYVPDVVHSIEAAGRTSGLGDELPVVIDGGIEPWIWYLRDHKRVTYTSIQSNFQPEEGAVVIALASNETAMQPHLDRYQEPVRFPLRWWFPEFDTYKAIPTAGNFRGIKLSSPFRLGDWFVGQLFQGDSWETWWNYFRYRVPPNPPDFTGIVEDRLGRLDMIAYFPKEYKVQTPEVVAPPTQPPPGETPTAAPTTPPPSLPPQQALAADLSLSAPGGFREPAAVAVDAQGNVYVTEVGSHRILKFDPQGNFIAQVGSRGEGRGRFNEPWGIAVDAQGNVYVADTWNNRIQKFNPDLKFLLAWGQPASSLDNPEVDHFWGPRDVAVDAQGNVWVADGGTNRVLKFTAEGQFLEAFGGKGSDPGQFVEPNAIEIAPNGDVLVADLGNRRVQRFDPAFGFLAEYPIPGWLSIDSVRRAYIALLPDGGLVVSDPAQNKLLRLDAQGTPTATLDVQDATLAVPRGVAFDSRGFVYVAEQGTNQVRRLVFPP